MVFPTGNMYVASLRHIAAAEYTHLIIFLISPFLVNDYSSNVYTRKGLRAPMYIITLMT